MPTNLLILIAALIVALLIFRALLSIGKAIIGTAFSIFTVIMILSYFGFSPQDLSKEITNLPQIINHIFSGSN